MKTTLLIPVLLCLALLCPAQPPARDGQGDGQRPGPRFGRERDGDRPNPVERYLRHLEQTDEAEYERLNALRREDPEAFRRELREKAIRRHGGDPRRGGPHPLREQLQAVRNAETPGAREAAVEELRAKIAEMVDRNLERREERIRRVREELDRLAEQHAQEQARRGEIIEIHLRRLLEHGLEEPEPPPPPEDEPAPPPPPPAGD